MMIMGVVQYEALNESEHYYKQGNWTASKVNGEVEKLSDYRVSEKRDAVVQYKTVC